MLGVHRLASLIKRWILSTHQGSFSGKHLDYYLDEYTFRFNRRTSRSRGCAILPSSGAGGEDFSCNVPADRREKPQYLGGTCVMWIPPFS